MQVSFCEQLFNHPGWGPSHTQAQGTSQGQVTALHVSHQLYPLTPGKGTLSDRPRRQKYQEEHRSSPTLGHPKVIPK